MMRFLHDASRMIGQKSYEGEPISWFRVMIFLFFLLAFFALGILILVYALKNRPTVQSTASIYDYAGGASWDGNAAESYKGVIELLAVNLTKSISCGCTTTAYLPWFQNINRSELYPCLAAINTISNPLGETLCQNFSNSVHKRFEDVFLPFNFLTLDPETWVTQIQFLYSRQCDELLHTSRDHALMEYNNLINETEKMNYYTNVIEEFYDVLIQNAIETRTANWDAYGMCWLPDTIAVTLIPIIWGTDYLSDPPPYPTLPVIDENGTVLVNQRGENITWYDHYVDTCQPYFCYWFGTAGVESVLISTFGTIGTIFSVVIAVASMLYLGCSKVEHKFKKVRLHRKEKKGGRAASNADTQPPNSGLASPTQEQQQQDEEYSDDGEDEYEGGRSRRDTIQPIELSKELEQRFAAMEAEILNLKQDITNQNLKIQQQEIIISEISQLLQKAGAPLTREMKTSLAHQGGTFSFPPSASSTPYTTAPNTPGDQHRKLTLTSDPEIMSSAEAPIRRVKRKRRKQRLQNEEEEEGVELENGKGGGGGGKDGEGERPAQRDCDVPNSTCLIM